MVTSYQSASTARESNEALYIKTCGENGEGEMTNHELRHDNSWDINCPQCASEFDWVAEARKIVEGKPTMWLPNRKMLEACLEQIEEQEADMVNMREILSDTRAHLLKTPPVDTLTVQLCHQIGEVLPPPLTGKTAVKGA